MSDWITICNSDDISPNSGVCAKVGGHQVAIFFSQRTQSYHAISNYDPIGEANVLSRGIIGSIGDQLCVASPLYKQHYSLTTGQCLEQPNVVIPVFDVKLEQGKIHVAVPQEVYA